MGTNLAHHTFDQVGLVGGAPRDVLAACERSGLPPGTPSPQVKDFDLLTPLSIAANLNVAQRIKGEPIDGPFDQPGFAQGTFSFSDRVDISSMRVHNFSAQRIPIVGSAVDEIPSVFGADATDNARGRDFTCNSIIWLDAHQTCLDVTGRGRADILAGRLQYVDHRVALDSPSWLWGYAYMRWSTGFEATQQTRDLIDRSVQKWWTVPQSSLSQARAYQGQIVREIRRIAVKSEGSANAQ